MTDGQWLPLSGLQANGDRINGAGDPGTSCEHFSVSGYIFKIAHNSRGGIPGWTRSPSAEKRCRERTGDGEEEMGHMGIRVLLSPFLREKSLLRHSQHYRLYA